MIAHFSRQPLGLGRGSLCRFFTDPFVFHVSWKAAKEDDTPEKWQAFFDRQLVLAREYLREHPELL